MNHDTRTSPNRNRKSPTESSRTEKFRRTAFRVVIFVYLAAILVRLFRLYTFVYFWLDDFDNLYWVQQESGWEMAKNILNPASHFFRPSAMLVYWINLQAFDLAPLPYHILAWSLHGLNVALIYFLLKRLLESEYAAAFGALLYTCPPFFFDIYWNFGTIFELVSGALFFAGLLLYLRSGDTVRGILLVSAVYVLAVKAKEMAITLPVVCLWYELVLGKSVSSPVTVRDWLRTLLDFGQWKHVLKKLALPACVALWFTCFKAAVLTTVSDPTDAYYTKFSIITMGRGFGWYWNALSPIHLGWGGWAAIAVLAAGLLAVKNRLALFFLGYIFISFVPVIFLPNHRFDFYWYLPLMGLCGLAGLVVKWASQRANARMAPRWSIVAAGVVFVLAGELYFAYQKKVTADARNWARYLSAEYRSFVLGLRALPPPPANETVYYGSIPRYFDPDTIRSVTQVAFRRTDLEAKIVKEFPPEARYRVRFENSSVILDRGSGGVDSAPVKSSP